MFIHTLEWHFNSWYIPKEFFDTSRATSKEKPIEFIKGLTLIAIQWTQFVLTKQLHIICKNIFGKEEINYQFFCYKTLDQNVMCQLFKE